jgi:hypothetical protein
MSDNLHIERVAAEQGARGLNCGGRSDAMRLLAAVLSESVIGAGCLEDMGKRASLLAWRLVPSSPLVPDWVTITPWTYDLSVAQDCDEGTRQQVVELLTDNGRVAHSARLLGRRVSLLAYAFRPQCDPAIEDVLPSLARLGELWQLKASNQRSAPSAALKALMDDMIVRASARMHRGGAAFTPWFSKSREASAVFAEAQEGNTNRGGQHRRNLRKETSETL